MFPHCDKPIRGLRPLSNEPPDIGQLKQADLRGKQPAQAPKPKMVICPC